MLEQSGVVKVAPEPLSVFVSVRAVGCSETRDSSTSNDEIKTET